MTRQELTKYQDRSVRIDYHTTIGPQSRNGFVFAVTQKNVVFWVLNDDEKEIEINIPFEDIDDINLVND